MSVFGPRYPAKLQEVINHAEAFADLISTTEVRNNPAGDLTRAWLIGRSEELEAVIASVLEDLKAGQVSEEAAVSAIGSYLRALHMGARNHLGFGDVLDCCVLGTADTALAVQLDALTVRVDLPQASMRDTATVQSEDPSDAAMNETSAESPIARKRPQ